MEWFEQLTRDGYVLLPAVFAPDEIEQTRLAAQTLLANSEAASIRGAERGAPAFGARNLLESWPAVVELTRKPILASALIRVLGPGVGLVRGLYFDKPPGHTWALPWHRDLTVAVKAHGTLGRFRRPTTKAGVPHLGAPIELLETMLTARIHLDDVTDANGPLRVLPGSHLNANSVLPNEQSAISIHCNAGDVLLMRPLLYHASASGEPDHREHRRVVHLEFAASSELPDSYQWRDFVGLMDAA